ncbi:thioredoxin domain-containing protein [Streptomyces sp. PKU-MA01144]|uniref:DsbA family protein n=1 Tax=Streptomyces TaxID=1883 RepID=UPI00147EF1E3|nr:MULTISPECIES: DsbA family protein [Streptomyces]MCY0983385.1 thioredoxin domain-containing protein [Streptomyces tirandamycinicus]NNJ08107.1 thioredoxin domain-containing protein [Streptomyces sp. PKU-MA01144]
MPASRTPARSGTRSGRSVKPFAYGAAVAAAAVLLGFVSYTATKPDDSATGGRSVADVSADPDAGVYPELEKLARRDAGDPLALGRADAPVVMVEYADFQCGYCGKFARDTEPELIRKYVEKGVLRIEWRNFPIFGEESEAAARAAWAAGRQGRFWQFHKAAYADGAKEQGFGEQRLRELAAAAGVKDLARFSRDADGEEARQAVARDQEEGYGLGATSTPSFVVNGRPIAGAQPERTFVEAIEAAREAATTEPAGPESAPTTPAPGAKTPGAPGTPGTPGAKDPGATAAGSAAPGTPAPGGAASGTPAPGTAGGE